MDPSNVPSSQAQASNENGSTTNNDNSTAPQQPTQMHPQFLQNAPPPSWQPQQQQFQQFPTGGNRPFLEKINSGVQMQGKLTKRMLIYIVLLVFASIGIGMLLCYLINYRKISAFNELEEMVEKLKRNPSGHNSEELRKWLSSNLI